MKAVIVCTSVAHGNTSHQRVSQGFQHPLRRPVGLLEQKGFEVVDTFSCRGLDTWGPFKLVGGIRKGRPNATDLEAARRFAGSVGACR